MKKNYMTPSVKEIAFRCDGKLLETSMGVNEEETKQMNSKDDIDDIFGW